MTEELEPGTVVRSAMASHSVWVKTTRGWVWIDRYTGDVQTTVDHVVLTDEEAMAGPEFWVQAWDGRTIKQWERVEGGVVNEGATWATAGYEPRQPPSVFVQWKGTEVCLDFTCACGYGGHFDGGFAYGLRCAECGREWTMPHTFGLLPDPDGVVQDTNMERHDPDPAAVVADYVEVRDEDTPTLG